MNLFEFFVNINHRPKTSSYIETTATFTGNRNVAGNLSKINQVLVQDFYEYEIEYEANGTIRKGFYRFYPLPDPAPEEIKGKTIRIRYNKRRPYKFDFVSAD